MAKATEKTRRLTQLALLVAIMLVLAFTPLGYLLLGPASGAFLGGVFGLTSFIQCFGMSQFGATLLGIDAVRTFLVCMVSRVLMGWLCGLIFKALHKLDKTRFLSYAAASLSAAVLNTVFFMGLLMLLFGQTDFILNMRGGMNLIAFLAAFVGIQGVVEAIVAFALGTAISKAVSVVLARK